MVKPQYQEDSRYLYEQSQSKTLIFTTSLSSNLPQVDGSLHANTGLYQCTLEPDNNFDDFNDGDEYRENCHVASKLADRLSFSLSRHTDLQLRNIQFDLSSLRSDSSIQSKQNFLYANTHGKYTHNNQETEWEIIRAELPKKGDFDSDALMADGSLRFESVFRTCQEISWNECNFDCCKTDDHFYESWEEIESIKYKQAFVRAFVRSFAVDEHTGDVYISWEGFWKDCGDVFESRDELEYTIGVSRLKTENDLCMNSAEYTDPSLFGFCTEPVSIVYQSSQRDVVIPYGGFSVIPASSTGVSKSEDGKRVFLLSVLDRPDFIHGETTSKIWAIPEGVDGFRDKSKRQELGEGKVVDSIFFNSNVWDGGSLRLHYDPVTGKPDHLCRTVYEQGIECLPISVTLDDGYPVVYTTAYKNRSQMFLSQKQTEVFCRLEDDDNSSRVNWGRMSTLVTGLDVQWNQLNGQPERIFFGCWGGVGGRGAFGSVEKNGNHLMQVMPGAHADAVLFLPQELEGTIDPREPPPTEHPRPCVVEARAAHEAQIASSFGKNTTSASKSVVVGVAMFVLALCLAIYKRRRLLGSRLWSLSNSSQREIGFGTRYVELSNFDDCPPETMEEEVTNVIL